MTYAEKEFRSRVKMDINCILLTITFTVFTLIISLKPTLLQGSPVATMQLTLAIPLLISSIFARAKITYVKKLEMWERYGFFTYLLGYTFLINVISILMSECISIGCGIMFLAANLCISAIYSIFEVIESKAELDSKIRKDLLFFIIIVLGGFLPIAGLY